MRKTCLAPLLGALLLAGAAPAWAAGGSGAHSPHAGQEGRRIKALSPEDVAGLVDGAGLGFAKAAELNGVPGPAHVLELADALGLDPAQRRGIEAIHGRMREAARALGREMVAREADLDRDFAGGGADPASVAGATDEIGRIAGRLRAVHLVAHLETQAALTPAQVRRYAELRGYAAEGARGDGRAHGTHGHR